MWRRSKCVQRSGRSSRRMRPDMCGRTRSPIAVRLFPDAVVTYRSPPVAGPVGGVLYIVRGPSTTGLIAAGDAGTSRPRCRAPARRRAALRWSTPRLGCLAENCRESRRRGGQTARMLDEPELGDWIDRLCRNEGEKWFADHRTRASELGDELGIPRARLHHLDELIGLVLATCDAEATSPALAPWAAGQPVDPVRVELVERLAEALTDALRKVARIGPALRAL